MKKIAAFFKALGDETRLKIVEILSTKEMCVCEIIDCLQLSQPAVSHHLKILKQAGLIKDSREGKWIYYSLNPNVFDEVFEAETEEIIKYYAKPIETKFSRTKDTKTMTRTSPAECERLVKKQNKEN